jgi:hypothetical protein
LRPKQVIYWLNFVIRRRRINYIQHFYRRTSGPKREEVARGWRRLRNEELPKLHILPNIIRVIKSRKTLWLGHEARKGKMRNVYKEETTRNSEDTGVDRSIILDFISGI